MKNTLIAVVTFLLCLGAAMAQPNPPSKEKQLIHLKRILQLDDKQTEKVKSILSTSDVKIKEYRDKMDKSRQELIEQVKKAREKDMEEMDKLMADQDNQIIQVLTDNQKVKFDEFRDERPAPRPDDGFGPPPPSPDGCKMNKYGPKGCDGQHMMGHDKMNPPDEQSGPPNK